MKSSGPSDDRPSLGGYFDGWGVPRDSSEPSGVLADANDKLDRLLGRVESTEPSDEWPRCDFDGLPATCYGADLAYPRRRCPRCCHRDSAFDGHGDPTAINDHIAAEGVAL